MLHCNHFALVFSADRSLRGWGEDWENSQKTAKFQGKRYWIPFWSKVHIYDVFNNFRNSRHKIFSKDSIKEQSEWMLHKHLTSILTTYQLALSFMVSSLEKLQQLFIFRKVFAFFNKTRFDVRRRGKENPRSGFGKTCRSECGGVKRNENFIHTTQRPTTPKISRISTSADTCRYLHKEVFSFHRNLAEIAEASLRMPSSASFINAEFLNKQQICFSFCANQKEENMQLIGL